MLFAGLRISVLKSVVAEIPHMAGPWRRSLLQNAWASYVDVHPPVTENRMCNDPAPRPRFCGVYISGRSPFLGRFCPNKPQQGSLILLGFSSIGIT